MTVRPFIAFILFGSTTAFGLAIPDAFAETGKESIRIDTPKGGWQQGGAAGYTQNVQYPAVRVSTPDGQPDAAQIRGMIENAPKDARGPARLVVNGVAMPMRVEDDGSFSRPYAFSRGSNSVEVRAPDGAARQRVQFYHLGENQTPAKLRVVLAWDSDNTDLDLHVISPDGEHTWYGQRVSPNGGTQDVDVTTGYGPEIFSMPSPIPGTYLVYVNYYGGGYRYNEDGTSEAGQDLTTAEVTVITEEGTVNEKKETVLVPMREPGELTLVKRFAYP